jgi:GNAT superfamily N-acetyltransferase
LPGVQLVEPSSDRDFGAYYYLRWRILREPWGQPRGSERDDLDGTSIHFMARAPDGSPVGVARVHFLTPVEAQLRYMAVEENHRGRGIGTLLLSALENRAREAGALSMVLDARESAVGFYRRRGYRDVHPAHTLFDTIPHIRMEKRL